MTFLTPLLDRPGVAHRLTNDRTGGVLADALEGAFDSKSRRRGLLGRDHLPAGAGLAIAPCNSIHMFFMKFPIDVVFVARDGRVVKAREHVKPWRIALAPRAHAVIELPVGAIARSGTRPGDRLVVGG